MDIFDARVPKIGTLRKHMTWYISEHKAYLCTCLGSIGIFIHFVKHYYNTTYFPFFFFCSVGGAGG